VQALGLERYSGEKGYPGLEGLGLERDIEGFEAAFRV
jgi:hypothetical protein